MNTTYSLHTFKIFPKNHNPRNLHLPRKHDFIFPTEPILTITTKSYNLFNNKINPSRINITEDTRPNISLINNDNVHLTNKYYLYKILDGKDDTIQNLLVIATQMAQHTSFKFYTDSSLIGLQTLPYGIWMD
jgi:hypothetical protein